MLAERFHGRLADLAQAVERDDAYIWQLIHGRRNIGERVARDIEKRLHLAAGALESSSHAGQVTLAPDEAELLSRYREASASWKLALRYLAAVRGEIQDQISDDVDHLLAKLSLEHRLEQARPQTLHSPEPHFYRKKHS